jgi:hypothetical protein
MNPPHDLLHVYLYGLAISWFVFPFYVWVNYLDVRTTLRDVMQAGDIESNPNMVPYVKRTDFWLMVRGKLRVEHYMSLVSLVFPPLVVAPLIDGFKVLTAVRSNEKLSNSQGIPGDAPIDKRVPLQKR